MKLALIGLRGTGKSTVGQILAQRLGWSFFDTDEWVQRTSGKTIRELFEQQGEPAFRTLECKAVAVATALDPAVIATGGGAILNVNNVKLLRADGFVVHLSADPSELWRRISQDTASHATRPQLVAGHNGPEELRRLMLDRAAVYAEARDVEVDVEGRTPGDVADAILLLLRTHGKIPS